MNYLSDIDNLKLHNTVIALGKFDGLHKGHMLLVDKISSMKRDGFTTVLCTIDMGKGSIYSDEEKISILKDKNIDYLIKIPFTEEFAKMSPKDFIKEILVNKFDVKCIVVGADFRFGYKRSGSVETLKILALRYRYKVFDIEKLNINDEVVSSTRIKEELFKGNMKEVSNLLGRDYFVSGKVSHGKKLGNTIGFPTANLILDKNKLIPMSGVYASITKIDGKEYRSMTNIGNNPTIADNNPVICETHIFDFEDNIYDRFIEVSLVLFIRNEEKFDSIDSLKIQLKKDISFIKGLKN